jgi:predicted nucleic acid-binding protein
VIVYLDTSAFVPLFIDEPSSSLCRDIVAAVDGVVVSRLLWPETAGALAKAVRTRRINQVECEKAWRLAQGYLNQCHVVELDETLARMAADAALTYGLRGYDSVHHAAATRAANAAVVLAASGDAALLSAWRRSGLTTVDTAQPA